MSGAIWLENGINESPVPAHAGLLHRLAVSAAFALLMLAPVEICAASVESAAIMVTGHGGSPLFSPRGVAVDKRRGEIVLANTGMHRIEFFDFGGRSLSSQIRRVTSPDGSAIESQPIAVAVDSKGRLLVSDLLCAWVDVLDFRGRTVAKLALASSDVDSVNAGGPGALAVGPDGTIYVGTRGSEGRIYLFGPDYRARGVWGEPGKLSGQLSRITGLALTPGGDRLVVVCDGTDLAVQLFEPDGRFLSGFGRHEIGPGNFSFPSGVAITADGRIWVSDEIRQIIQVFDPQGQFLGMEGSGGEGPGEFLYPCALASDGDSLLAVAERVGNRAQLLRAR